MRKNSVLKNIVMLYGFSIAKLIFPLLTLPYLTRVLSVDTYGVVGYVKSIMTYMQLIIDFGFMLSGTKEIVLKRDDKRELSKAIGDILSARLVLCLTALVGLIILCFALPILRSNIIYTLLSFVPIVMTVFLFDYVFRGLEKMQVITSRFIIMKGFSTVLTLVLVKSDTNLMFIPLLDIIGSIFAIILVVVEFKKIKITIAFTGIKAAFQKLKDSAVYFVSNIATTVGGALSTILIGAFMSASDIAYWTASMQLVNAVLALYNPVVEGVYPNVVKNHNYNIIKKVATIFMPIIVCGCVFVFLFSKQIVTIAFGDKYLATADIIKGLIPIFFFAFPAQLVGWPMLGTIGKAKQVTISTIIYGGFNIVGLMVLIVIKQFNLSLIVILRSLSEFILFASRGLFCMRFKSLFNVYMKGEERID